MAPFHEALATQARSDVFVALDSFACKVMALKQTLINEHNEAVEVLQQQNALLREELAPFLICMGRAHANNDEMSFACAPGRCCAACAKDAKNQECGQPSPQSPLFPHHMSPWKAFAEVSRAASRFSRAFRARLLGLRPQHGV